MNQRADIGEYVSALLNSQRLGSQVAYHSVLPVTPPQWGKPARPWPAAIRAVLRRLQIDALYSHQIEALDRIRAGCHVVIATPTASGKTLVYNLPVIEAFLSDAGTRALYLFPLKALAQDQLRMFQATAAGLSGAAPRAAIYDGDTTAWRRKRIRTDPPNVLLTNPDMLHLSLLPYHAQWADFLTGLSFVVVDEVHTYRGVMGSHMAQVFRRFLRVCRRYGAEPTFVFSSATVANPAELSAQLTGLTVEPVIASGAPQGKRHLIFIDPYQGAARTAIWLLKAALNRQLRTIVYTQSRKLTELIALWAGSQAGPLAQRISAYRAGFLPEERRQIEARLASGKLLAVIATSALELGIDIGDLDLCILVGYPGTVVSTWQRSGRVGRSGQESAMVLIAGEDALDQYFVRNPQDFIKRPPEAAVINPVNPDILAQHLPCAAAETPLQADEPLLRTAGATSVVAELESRGALLRSADGDEWYASRKAPHRRVDLRGTGERYAIVSGSGERPRGEIDAFRAFKETHPGAIYLHRGETFRVDAMEIDTRTVRVTPAPVDYYTRVRDHKETEILDIYDSKSILSTEAWSGRLKVTDQVTGYEKWRIQPKKRLNIVPLQLPPLIFETDGLWIKIPPEVQRAAEKRRMHFMGGIHAMEHAAIGIFPLLVMADRNDLGGISIPLHPQVDAAAVFIYDGVPGGGGLSRQAFARAEDLLHCTLKAIRSCPCESGCPSCVHSPKCGSGNRPIDKQCAIFILEALVRGPQALPDKGRLAAEAASPQVETAAVPQAARRTSGLIQRGRRRRRKQHRQRVAAMPATDAADESGRAADICYGVLDIETQRSAEEVGGWHRAERMGISCAVLFDSDGDCYREFDETRLPELIENLQRFDLVVGFNVKRFDYQVLRGYSDFDFAALPTLDLLEEIHRRLGYRLSLDHLARETLGVRKSADGLQALRWWKQGKLKQIVDYCRTDVQITRDLFLYGRRNGYLLFRNKAGGTVRVPVGW